MSRRRPSTPVSATVVAVTAERHRAAAMAVTLGLVTAVAALLTTLLVVLAAAAWAQTPPTVPGQSPEPDPLNAGGVVFFVTSIIIFGGALILYLRHRRPRSSRQDQPTS
jgi:hypothetical protein